MKWRLSLIFFVFVGVTAVSAQSDCGWVVPCGVIPWRLPQLPPLASPTPIPTVQITMTPTSEPAETPIPPPTAVPTLDTQNLGDQIATLNALIVATQQPEILDVNGTPVDFDESITEASQNMGLIFGYARGLFDMGWGTLDPMIFFMFIAFFVVLSVTLLTFTLPLLVSIFAIIRKIVQLILDFLPL